MASKPQPCKGKKACPVKPSFPVCHFSPRFDVETKRDLGGRPTFNSISLNAIQDWCRNNTNAEFGVPHIISKTDWTKFFLPDEGLENDNVVDAIFGKLTSLQQEFTYISCKFSQQMFEAATTAFPGYSLQDFEAFTNFCATQNSSIRGLFHPSRLVGPVLRKKYFGLSGIENHAVLVGFELEYTHNQTTNKLENVAVKITDYDSNPEVQHYREHLKTSLFYTGLYLLRTDCRRLTGNDLNFEAGWEQSLFQYHFAGCNLEDGETLCQCSVASCFQHAFFGACKLLFPAQSRYFGLTEVQLSTLGTLHLLYFMRNGRLYFDNILNFVGTNLATLDPLFRDYRLAIFAQMGMMDDIDSAKVELFLKKCLKPSDYVASPTISKFMQAINDCKGPNKTVTEFAQEISTCLNSSLEFCLDVISLKRLALMLGLIVGTGIVDKVRPYLVKGNPDYRLHPVPPSTTTEFGTVKLYSTTIWPEGGLPLCRPGTDKIPEFQVMPLLYKENILMAISVATIVQNDAPGSTVRQGKEDPRDVYLIGVGISAQDFVGMKNYFISMYAPGSITFNPINIPAPGCENTPDFRMAKNGAFSWVVSRIPTLVVRKVVGLIATRFDRLFFNCRGLRRFNGTPERAEEQRKEFILLQEMGATVPKCLFESCATEYLKK